MKRLLLLLLVGAVSLGQACAGDGSGGKDAGGGGEATDAGGDSDGGADGGAPCTFRRLVVPSTADLFGVWGTASSDVWAVGSGGTALHWDGSTWTVTPTAVTAELRSVWGASSSDLWAVGAGGLSLHWNGSSWTAVASGTSSDLLGVWGTSATDVWAVGDAGAILRWNGLRWSAVAGVTTDRLTSVSGTGPDLVWVAGGSHLHSFDGVAWTQSFEDQYVSLTGVAGTGATELWLTAVQGQLSFPLLAYGTVFHFQSGVWGVVSRHKFGAGARGVWSSASNDAWVAADRSVDRWTDGGLVPGGDCTSETLQSVWGTSPTDLWAVGTGGTVLRSR